MDNHVCNHSCNHTDNSMKNKIIAVTPFIKPGCETPITIMFNGSYGYVANKNNIDFLRFASKFYHGENNMIDTSKYDIIYRLDSNNYHKTGLYAGGFLLIYRGGKQYRLLQLGSGRPIVGDFTGTLA